MLSDVMKMQKEIQECIENVDSGFRYSVVLGSTNAEHGIDAHAESALESLRMARRSIGVIIDRIILQEEKSVRDARIKGVVK